MDQETKDRLENLEATTGKLREVVGTMGEALQKLTVSYEALASENARLAALERHIFGAQTTPALEEK